LLIGFVFNSLRDHVVLNISNLVELGLDFFILLILGKCFIQLSSTQL
jgi:hypothetical protein